MLLNISDLPRRNRPVFFVLFSASLSALSLPLTQACPGQHTHSIFEGGCRTLTHASHTISICSSALVCVGVIFVCAPHAVYGPIPTRMDHFIFNDWIFSRCHYGSSVSRFHARETVLVNSNEKCQLPSVPRVVENVRALQKVPESSIRRQIRSQNSVTVK